jgi:hypothetical protein
MQEHDPRYLHYFAHGLYDRLFAPYRNYRETDDLVHLASSHRRKCWWVVVRPTSNRAGDVLWSSFLHPGTRVRSRMPFRHAARRPSPFRIDTLGNPRFLEAWFMPQVVARPTRRRAA